eukprot:2179889-Rhodomonas_salina.1
MQMQGQGHPGAKGQGQSSITPSLAMAPQFTPSSIPQQMQQGQQQQGPPQPQNAQQHQQGQPVYSDQYGQQWPQQYAAAGKPLWGVGVGGGRQL